MKVLRLLPLFLPFVSFGQNTTLLDTVEVSANRISSRLVNTGRQIQIIDQDQMRATPQGSISDALEQHTVADVRQRGPFDVQTDLSLRGGTFDQNLVLIDGIPMNDPQTGHHQMNIPLEVLDLERVEVLYGGASRTFGPGAFSGAVNFITRTPEKNQGHMYLTLGENGLWGWHLSQSVVKKKNWLRASFFKRHSEGYGYNTDFDITGATLKAGTSWRKYSGKLMAGYSEKRFGALNYYSSRFPDQHEYTTTLHGAAELSRSGEFPWKIRGYYRMHRDRFELFREGPGYYRFENGYFIRNETDTAGFGPGFYYTFHNQHRTGVGGAEAEMSHRWLAGTSSVGVQVKNEKLWSNAMGQPLENPISITGARENFTKGDDRSLFTFFAEHDWQFKGLRLNLGTAAQSSTINTLEWLPGIDLSYRWKGKHTVYASTGRSMRLPTFTDLYYNRGGAVGSLDLQPEFATHFEAGYRFRFGNNRLRTAIFRRQGTNLIDWTLLPGDSVTRASNLTQVDLNGVEFSADHQGKGWFKRIGLMYSLQWTDQAEFDFESLYVLDHLRHNAVIFWDIALMRQLELQLRGRVQERNGSYVRFSDGQTVPYEVQSRLDVQLSWEITNWAVFVNVYNVLDQEQFDRADVQLPGRWISTGVRMSW